MEQILGNEKQVSNRILDLVMSTSPSARPPPLCSSSFWSQDTRVYLCSSRSTLATAE